MKHYLFSKLSDINHRMAVHEADANRRLASEGLSLLIIPTSAVHLRFQKPFSKLRALIEDAYARVSVPGHRPSKFHKIINRTASKYIGMLISIEDEWRNEIEQTYESRRS